MADDSTSRTLTALFDVFDSLSQLGDALSEAQWKTPTDLPGWTVQDNLSHLIAIERVLEGDAATTHRASDLSRVKNPIGEMNEHEVDARRSRAGHEVLAEWHEIVGRRRSTLTSAGDDYFAQPSMTPTGPGTLADFLSIRVLDCWLHEQDMRRAVGLAGHLGGPAAEHTIDRLLRTVPIVVGKRAGAPEGATVVLRISGDVERTVVVTVTNGRAAVVPAAPDGSHVVAELSLTTEAFVVLASGRGGRDHPAVAGCWSSAGDDVLAGRIIDQLNMMI